MGRVTASVTLSNLADELAVERGDLAATAVRRLELPEILVDTGATNLCLPARLVTQLGLTLFDMVEVATAAGVREARLVGPVRLQVADRVNVFTCVEISDEAEPLLGVIPLETLGLNPNVHTQQVEFLRMDKQRTYITA